MIERSNAKPMKAFLEAIGRVSWLSRSRSLCASQCCSSSTAMSFAPSLPSLASSTTAAAASVAAERSPAVPVVAPSELTRAIADWRTSLAEQRHSSVFDTAAVLPANDVLGRVRHRHIVTSTPAALSRPIRSFLTPEPTPSWSGLSGFGAAAADAAASEKESAESYSDSEATTNGNGNNATMRSKRSSPSPWRRRGSSKEGKGGSGSGKPGCSISEFPPDAFDPSFPDQSPAFALAPTSSSSSCSAPVQEDKSPAAVTTTTTTTTTTPVAVAVAEPVFELPLASVHLETPPPAAAQQPSSPPRPEIAAPGDASPTKRTAALARTSTALRHEDFLSNYFGTARTLLPFDGREPHPLVLLA